MDAELTAEQPRLTVARNGQILWIQYLQSVRLLRARFSPLDALAALLSASERV